MGTITDSIAAAFRDFVSDGVPSSGLHEPIKADIRALGPLIETAIGNAGLGALVSVTKTTKALLDADLAHAADTVALVYADATDANNDLYVKTGASGAGAWTLTSVLHAAVAALFADPLQQAQSWAEGPGEPGGPGTKSAKEHAEDAAASAEFLGTVVTEQIPLNVDDLAFAVRDPATLQVPFGVRKDARGTLINDHVEEIEATANEAALSRQKVDPTDDAVAWGVAQRDAAGRRALLFGVRDRDGRIINPSFDALWTAVFGGGGGSGDLSEDNSIIMHGPHIYAVEGRQIEYYASSLLPNRNANSLSRIFTLQSVAPGKTPLGVVFRDYARVEANSLGAAARIKLQNASLPRTVEFEKEVTVIKSAADKTGSPRVMTIGDSITSQISALLPAALAQTALTPVYVGTLLSSGDGVTRHEGRSGWAARNFTYADMIAPSGTALPPLPIGDETAYLAMPAGNANLLNPFIRAATGGDDPAKVFNGYIFDFRFYLDRFGYGDPDVVIINLGTNDWMTGDLATVPSRMVMAFESVQLMVAQIKAACPDCKIGLAIPQVGSNSFSDPRWFQGYAELFLRYHETYGASSASGIYLLNTHAMMENRFTPITDLVSTNARTGQTKRSHEGDVHPGVFLGRPQLTEGYLAFIHAIS